MADLAKLVDELSSLTVLEAAELSKMLEEKWGVSAAAPVAVAAAPAAGGAGAAVFAAGRGGSTMGRDVVGVPAAAGRVSTSPGSRSSRSSTRE